ncbi:MAG: FkbM family methyltransferase [Bacteroidota bacterium]
MLKRFFKRNSHNGLFKALAGFGRSLNRLYENRNHDIYSNGEFHLLQRLSKLNPKLIIDGGANKGDWAIQAATCLPSSSVYAFEPVGDTFQELKESVKDYPQVQAIELGFFKENEEREINTFSSSTHASLYDIQGLHYSPEGKSTIQLVSGDSWLEKEKIDEVDFLKLDIEGAEYDALLGFEQAFRQKKIRLVQFEYGYINITTKKLLIDYYQLFEEWGYQVGKLFPKQVEFRPYAFKYEDFLGPNYVAVHQEDKELIRLLEG